jgi:hypothetical protein
LETPGKSDILRRLMVSRAFIRLFAIAVALSVGVPLHAAPAQVDYSRDILPILSDNCYHCHDEKARKAKLRLDLKEGAFRVQDGVTIINPGDPKKSELIRRVTATDPDDVMPPPKSNRKLTPKQIDVLTRWVAGGAKWGMHWSFVPPVQPPLPKVKNAKWPKNAVDYFVLARLEKEGLAPAPVASKEALIRRVTLDLTGLPPTSAEIDSFLADKSANAFEKVVDRLLASSRYGERMASEWLDLARYADTHGFQMDRYRPTWPWRDWVIKAFNQNMPYDQFVTWQLAGDLLPNPTREQRLATAFNRHHLQNEEGGIIEEEYRVAYVVDRVNTFGTAFLGLTTECSRCHDHKYDPLTQRDFYSLLSFFQNIDESGQTSYFTESTPVPTAMLWDDKTEAKIKDLQTRIQKRESGRTVMLEGARARFRDWPGPSTNDLGRLGLVAHFDFNEVVSNKLANLAATNGSGRIHEDPRFIGGKFGKAAELSGENGFTFPGIGHFSRADPFSLSIWVETTQLAPRAVVVHHSKAPVDAGSRGYELLLENGHVAFGLHHMWPGNSLKVMSRQSLPTNTWTHLAVSYDGSSRASGVKIFIDGQSVESEVIRDGLFKDISYEGGEPELAIGYRFRDNGFKGGHVDEFRVYNRALTAVEVEVLAGQGTVARDKSDPALFDYFIAGFDEPAKKWSDELHRLRREEATLVNSVPEIMAMEEMPRARPAFVLKRGAYDAPGEQVFARTPAVLPPFPPSEPTNRLGLAHWLLAPNHPLIGRVTVNRAWQMVFGRGIVETSDNFGSQGSFPSHPELLDWLAREFTDRGWDMKRLLKLIVISATYQQSSRADAELLARDPTNELLARGPARRLTAEMLRDQALALSGLLVEKIGGPSVKPYQPEGLWEEKAMGAPKYDQSKGANLHRRSLYTFWKRTVPHPAMIAFDASERNVCTVRRQSTSTPLQALTLLNDTQIVEAARLLGQRMLTEGGQKLPEQLGWAFRTCAGRNPSKKESDVLMKLYQEQRELFASDEEACTKLLAVGEAKNASNLAKPDLCASTVTCLALFNHDEVVMHR